MCDSIRDGGRRCATHTRPGFEAAIDRVDQAPEDRKAQARADGVGEVAAHASTRTGLQELDTLISHASDAQDVDQTAWLTTCRRLGESQRAAADEIRRVIRAHQDQAASAPLGPLHPGDVVYLGESTVFLGLTDVRRGTYVRVRRQHGDTADVDVLAFRPGDTNRAKRSPRNPDLQFQPGAGHLITVPTRNLRRPGTNDDTAAFYRTHTVEWEGDYFTEQAANEIIRAEPESDFHLHADFGPTELTGDDRVAADLLAEV